MGVYSKKLIIRVNLWGIKTVKIKVYRKLPVSEIYPCNSRDIKELKFEQLHSFSVSFGLNPEYSLDRFDKQKYKFPTIRGQVIAYANIMGSERK